VPNRSTTSTHSAKCSPGGRFPVDGSWAGITTQLYRCVNLASSDHSQHGLVAAGHAVTFFAQRGESGGGLIRRVPMAR
jgi:hypothetical protein